MHPRKIVLIAPLLGSFLLIYVGGLLRSHARGSEQSSVSFLQASSIWAIIFVLGLAAIPLENILNTVWLDQHRKTDILECFMIIAGFWGFWIGFSDFSQNKIERTMMLWLLLVYGLCNIVYFCVDGWQVDGYELGFWWVSIFAAFKVVFSILFCFVVSKSGMNNQELKKSIFVFAFGLFKIRPAVS